MGNFKVEFIQEVVKLMTKKNTRSCKNYNIIWTRMGKKIFEELSKNYLTSNN